MASQCIAYRDRKGALHESAQRATLSDLADVLGWVGVEGGMTPGVANLIFEKRKEIERIFAQHDKLNQPTEAKLGAEVVRFKNAG